ncbi:MAG: hypothetical protein LQ347_001479 [Umbilicaria vellea]|nr:MAG: hypothetical protein LQ347_001479 [Umbilicaria vellea]
MDSLGINASKIVHPPNPFYPLNTEVVGYLANEWPVPTLLGIFAAGWVVILGATNLMVKRHNPTLAGTEKAAILWFVLSGTIHLFFEGYFAYNHTRMGGAQDLFGQLWKEYAMSDSRYLTSDPFVLCMETVTAVIWGPLCFVVAWFITTQHPLRYPLQAIVSSGQIYGDILYYATSMFDHYYKGLTYSRPEAYYFWGYYVFMNFIWIVIPGILLYDSVDATARAFRALDTMSNKLQGNGRAKKSN